MEGKERHDFAKAVSHCSIILDALGKDKELYKEIIEDPYQEMSKCLTRLNNLWNDYKNKRTGDKKC